MRALTDHDAAAPAAVFLYSQRAYPGTYERDTLVGAVLLNVLRVQSDQMMSVSRGRADMVVTVDTRTRFSDVVLWDSSRHLITYRHTEMSSLIDGPAASSTPTPTTTSVTMVLELVAGPPPQPVDNAADLTNLRASLRNAQAAQEIHYSYPGNNYTYASDAARLMRYTPEPGVRFTILEATQKGWAGMVQLESGIACVVFIGGVSKAPTTPRGTAASKDGVIACDEPSAR